MHCGFGAKTINFATYFKYSNKNIIDYVVNFSRYNGF